MNKKMIIGLFSVLFIAIATIGTVAYFSKSFTSDANAAVAASFEVDAVNSKGETIGNGQFELGGKLYPGMPEVEAYSFQIKKNNTDVPVEYSVNLITSGELFTGNSPVRLTLKRNIDNQWVDVDYSQTFTPQNDIESYKIVVDWPHGNNDIAYQGKTGNVKLSVVATQVDAVEEPEEPTGPPYFTGEVAFKATPNGSTRTTTNKEVNFHVNDKGFRVIEVLMGDGNAEFEKKVGKVTVTEELVNGNKFFRVITENEYYASPTQIWRSSVANLDLETEGVAKFPAALGKYLTIESQALYNWLKSN